MCKERDFVFIDNSNISVTHLWNDGLHLLESGKALMANNFISHLNYFSSGAASENL
jgi:predicted O-methyltransferase YrrM